MIASREQQVAELHQTCLSGSFLATLGTAFLTLMYEAMSEAPDAFLITEQRAGHVVGFVTGGLSMAGTYRCMLRRPFRLMAALAPSIFRPMRLRRILEIIRYGAVGDPALPKAELLSLAVEPSFRGAGIADELFRRLEDEFSARGVQRFRITVGQGLAAAHSFYRRMGAVVAGVTAVHGAQESLVYVHSISP